MNEEDLFHHVLIDHGLKDAEGYFSEMRRSKKGFGKGSIESSERGGSLHHLPSTTTSKILRVLRGRRHLSHGINHYFKSEIHHNVTYGFYSRPQRTAQIAMRVPLILGLADVDSTSTYESCTEYRFRSRFSEQQFAFCCLTNKSSAKAWKVNQVVNSSNDDFRPTPHVRPTTTISSHIWPASSITALSIAQANFLR